MTKQKSMAYLRRTAEKELKKKTAEDSRLSRIEKDTLIHELRTYQIELEMQNEELRRAQEELDESRRNFGDLFDMAPVGYFRFDRNGLILEMNRTASIQLGRERERTIRKPFSPFIKGGYKDLFYSFLVGVNFEENARRNCEIIITRPDGSEFFARLDGVAVNRESCLVTMTNITEQKRLEGELQRLIDERTAKLEEEKARARELEVANRRLKELAGQIRNSLREKEILLQELNHRTKNNMNVISSLITLQISGLGREPDEKMVQLLKDTQNRIQAMALVHEKLYKSKNISRVDVSEYIKDLADYILSSHGERGQGITLELELEHIEFPIDKAIPCGLILNELMSNALKHAFPKGKDGKDNKRISIILRRNGKEIDFRFGDNGVGPPPWMDLAKSASLGLKLVYNLVAKQLRGSIRVIAEEGTEFRMEFAEKAVEDGKEKAPGS